MKKPTRWLALVPFLMWSNGAAAAPIDLLVPAYANPCCNDGPAIWTALIDAAGDPALNLKVNVIFNPASGPGTAVDPNYVGPTGSNVLPLLRGAGGGSSPMWRPPTGASASSTSRMR